MPESTDDTITLEWSYTPKTFLEEPYEEKRDFYDLKIADGKVTATFPGTVFDNDQGILDRIHDELSLLFQGLQMNLHHWQRYELSRYSMRRSSPNRPDTQTIFASVAAVSFAAGHLDVVVRDAAGNVTQDTKRDRIQRQRRFAELSAKHGRSDATAAAILHSYDQSRRDPDNEFVHLYEIRDVLQARFQNNKYDVERALGITTTQWDSFTQIANNLPIRQGRHRGRHPEPLRDATEAEFTEMRTTAKAMIEAYLDYLERGGTPYIPQP